MADQRAIKAGKAYVEVGAKDTLNADLKKIGQKMKAWGAGLAAAGGGLAGAGTGVLGIFGVSLKTLQSVGDQLDKMSARTGFSVEALSGLGFAAEQSGASLEALETGIKGMTMAIGQAGKGSAEFADAFKAVGLSVDQLVGLSPESQFLAIADAVSQVVDPTQRAFIAMKLFGESGRNLLPLLDGGSAEIKALTDEAKKLGIVMSAEDAAAAAAFGDAMNRLKRQLIAVATSVGVSVVPAVLHAAAVMSGAVSVAIDFINKNRGLIAAVAGVAVAAVAAGTALTAIGTTLMVAGVAVSGLVAALVAVKAVLLAMVSPLGITVALLAAGAVAFFRWTEVGQQVTQYLLDVFGQLWSYVSEVVAAIGNAIAGGDLQLAAQIAGDAIKHAFITAAMEAEAAIRELVANTLSGLATLVNQLAPLLEKLTGFKYTSSIIMMGLNNAAADQHGQARGLRNMASGMNAIRSVSFAGQANRAASAKAAMAANFSGLDIGDIAAAVQSRSSFAGSTESGAIGALSRAGGVNVAERTATAAEQTAKNTKDLVDKLKNQTAVLAFQ